MMNQRSADPVVELRQHLALGYRILGMHRLGLGLLAHLTARSPGADTFWSYQLGQSVEEVRFEDLCEVDFSARPLNPTNRVNPTLAAHGDIYRARPDVLCIAHHHGDSCVASGAIGANLMPFDNNSARWHGDVCLVEDYNEVFSISEQGRLMSEHLRQGKALLLKHHGVITATGSVAESVVRVIEIEQSFGVQLKAVAAGELHLMPEGAIAECKKFLNSDLYFEGMWTYFVRRLKRERLDDGIGF